MLFNIRRIWVREMSAVFALLAVFFLPAAAMANTCQPPQKCLRMQTDLGGIDLELFDTQAPLTVANFLNYVNRGAYDGTFIHRSVPGFVVQGGGYIFNPDKGDFFGSGTSPIFPVDAPVKNEPDPVNRPNVRGTLAMAKTSDPDSATSEWFFNLADNASLDDPNNSGGFTVFGRVTGSGMAVMDAVAGLSRCKDVAPLLSLCGSFPEVPAADWSQVVTNDTLINIVHIGVDSDGDGVIDALEQAAPNNGDGNADGTLDSTQAGVASFPDSTGQYIVLEAPAGAALRSLDILGITFALANPPAFSGFFDALDFSHGFAGFDLTGLAAGGTANVTETFASGLVADTYYVFGPTADNATPHWYEFLYDGTTGAEIVGNKIILHYVDGDRGDADLDNTNGVIKASPGGPAINLLDADGDGVPTTIEDAAPNAGDGNNDGIADSLQGNVVSFPNVINGRYVTLVADSPRLFKSVSDQSPLLFKNPSKAIQGLNFPNGLFGFSVNDPDSSDAGAITVEVILPEGETPTTYYQYGPTPDNPEPHWYEFLYDGETGAEINGNVVTLHLVDGKRGDSDLTVNGTLVDPGAPAQQANNSGASGGGGGCSLAGWASHPLQAGAWWLLFTLMLLLRLGSAVSAHSQQREQVYAPHVG